MNLEKSFLFLPYPARLIPYKKRSRYHLKADAGTGKKYHYQYMAFGITGQQCYSLGLPQLTKGFRSEEASDEDQHQSLADETNARLVQLGYVHGTGIDVSVAI